MGKRRTKFYGAREPFQPVGPCGRIGHGGTPAYAQQEIMRPGLLNVLICDVDFEVHLLLAHAMECPCET